MKRKEDALAFRRAGREDRPVLARLVREYYAFDGLPFDAAATRAALRELLAHPEWGGAWLIASGGRTAGYVVLTPCFSLEFGREVFIDELYLRPAFRGGGLGRAALDFAARWAGHNGVAAIHVVTERNNPAARRFYRRGGFGGAHRYFMTRRLDA
jgi:GNAT superfamily N-acetyltransferase